MKETRTILAGAMCGVLIAGVAGAADVTLTTSDAIGTSSFNTSLHWSDGLAPSDANDYWVIVSGRTLRTPDNTAANFTFAGNSLTLTNGGKLLYKGTTSTITIPNLTVDGGELANGNASRTWTLAGGMTVGPNGVRLTVADSNNRTIIIPDPIVGVGALDTSAGALTAYGSRVVLTSDGNTYSGGTLIGPYSTLQLGNGGTTGTAGTGPITNNGALGFNYSYDMTINGPLFPTGTGGITKYGNNMWTWLDTPAANYVGMTTLNSGTLALGVDNKLGTGTLDLRGGTFRSLDAATRTVTNAMNISANIILGSAGTGDLVFSGPINNGAQAKVVTISNAVCTFASFSNTGVVTIQGPGIFRLAAGADIPNSSSITVAAGGTFDASVAGGFVNRAGKAFGGGGAVIGDLTVNGTVSPGAAGVGTLTLSNNLAVADGTLNFEVSNVSTPGSGTNDLIDVAGDLVVSGYNAINVFPAVGSFSFTNTLIRYGGNLTGDASYFYVANAGDYRQTFWINTDTPGEVRLVTSGGSGVDLVWSGGLGTVWDVRTTPNWNGDSEFFYATDSVLFDDTGATTTTIDLTGSLMPSKVRVDANIDYTFQGAGKISGGTSLVKTGPATLVINATNDYTGGTAISNGTVVVGSATALGTGGDVVIAGGTLDVNGIAMYNRLGRFIVSGSGLFGQGAIVNNGAGQNNAIPCLHLAGDATIAAAGNRWDVRSPTYGVDEIDLNGYTLTKTGAGQISIVQQVMTNSGSYDITAGTVSFTRSFVDGSGSVNASDGVLLKFENNSTTGWFNYFNKAVSVSGATIRLEGNSYGLGGPMSLSRDNTVDVTGTLIFTWSNTVSGAGSMAKIGTGTLVLLATNDYSGATVVSNGTLQVDGVNTGAGDVTIVATATLKGTGTVSGAVTVQDDAILAPGDSAGTLTINSNLTLSTGTFMDFELGTQSDLVVVNGDLLLGGRLRIADSGGFGPGTYTLMQYSGALSGSVPTLETIPNTNYTYAVSTNTPGQVDLVVSSGSLSPYEQWQMDYFGSTGDPNAAPDADPDGDRTDNETEFGANTNPTNSLSALIIIRGQQSGANFTVTWTAAGVRTNRLQVTTNLASGVYMNVDDPIVISTPGDATLNYTDVGAATNKEPRFYRIRVEP